MGAVLLAVALTVLLLGVPVQGAAGRSASCGSAWDTMSGRTGWREWWAQDLADPVDGSGRLVRTLRCPDAVDGRIVLAGVLAISAVVIVAAGEVAGRWRRRESRAAQGSAHRLARLGMVLTLIGALLTAAGVAGLALLTADPHDPLFLYVSRPVVVLAGLLLLLPAVLIVVLGRVVSATAAQLHTQEYGDAPP